MSTMSQSFAELKSGEEMRAFLVGKAADDAGVSCALGGRSQAGLK